MRSDASDTLCIIGLVVTLAAVMVVCWRQDAELRETKARLVICNLRHEHEGMKP